MRDDGSWELGVGTRWTEYCVVGFLVSVGEVKLSTKVFFPFGFSFGKERVGSFVRGIKI